MKERIEKKLKENVERILEKERLLPTDVEMLRDELDEIKEKEFKRKQAFDEVMSFDDDIWDLLLLALLLPPKEIKICLGDD